MITIKQFVFNPYQENTFVVYDDTKECIIIDPGCSSPDEKLQLQTFLSDHQLRLVKVVLTHGHFDHILGAHFLFDSYSISPSCHAGEVGLIRQAKAHGSMFGFEIEKPPEPKDLLSDEDVLRFGSTSLRIIHTPGHSEGSISLYCETDRFVMVGDVLFDGGIGRTDLPGGNFEVLMESITQKLLSLGDDVKVYPGHGPETTIGKERMSNPFIGGSFNM